MAKKLSFDFRWGPLCTPLAAPPVLRTVCRVEWNAVQIYRLKPS